MSLEKDEIIKDKIMEGATKLFQRFGLGKTTMEEIAREAGKGKSTLYYYFKSKEEIFEAIVMREKGAFFAQLQEEVAKAPTAIKKLEVLFSTRLRRLKELSILYRTVVEEASQLGVYDCNNVVRRQYHQKEADIIRGILQYGIVTGEFASRSDGDLEMLAFIFSSAHRGIERELIMENKVEEMTTRIHLFLNLIMKGLCSAMK